MYGQDQNVQVNTGTNSTVCIGSIARENLCNYDMVHASLSLFIYVKLMQNINSTLNIAFLSFFFFF